MVSKLWIMLQDTGHTRGDGGGPRFLNASHGHAQVRRFDQNHHPRRSQDAVDGIGNLLRQSLLDLEPARVDLGNPGELRQPQDSSIGHVTDMDLAWRPRSQIQTAAEEGAGGGGGETVTFPWNGTRWCSHRLKSSISRINTSSRVSTVKIASLTTPRASMA